MTDDRTYGYLPKTGFPARVFMCMCMRFLPEPDAMAFVRTPAM